MDIDTEIVDILEKTGGVRREDLIRRLIELHPAPDDRGYTKPTLNRKIAKLVESNKIIIVKKKDFRTFGISEKRKNASYLVSQNTIDKRRHIDKILTYLQSHQDKATIINVLEEIKRYEDEYELTPQQLDSLLDIPIHDEVVVMVVLSILHEYVFSKKIEPLDREKFVRNLRTIVKTFKNVKDIVEIARIEGISENFGLRQRPDLRIVYFTALRLLAHYGNDLVIERLKEDFSDPERKEINPPFYYNNTLFAKIFEKNNTALFEYQMELRRKGNNSAAHDIGILRDMAKGAVKGQSFPLNYEADTKKRFGEM